MSEKKPTENSHIIVPLNTNDCFGLQGLKINELWTDCYCRYL